jgi:uncharacterized protein (DUF1800 family)
MDAMTAALPARSGAALRGLLLATAAAWLVACGGSSTGGAEAASASVASSGQVAPNTVPKVSFYAASRFAEQASFGPTPALAADIQAKGLAGWIDAQFALPPSQHNLAPYLVNPVPEPADNQNYQRAFTDMAIAAPDQLRVRLAWTLWQVIAINESRGDRVGMLVFQNLMLAGAFGRYEELLHGVTRNAYVGESTVLRFNRIADETCLDCRPNTHYARALMGHFTIGPVLLEGDGSVKRVNGKPVPAYTPRDVSELARALTGWQFDPEAIDNPRLPRDWGNWRKPMVPNTFPGVRDYEAKRILGRDFAAYQSHDEQLRAVLDLLTGHDNAAPLMATRLIRHLVKSDPSPAYVQRVAAVFRNNGAAVRGDMKALVKAVLLDAEARAGDDPTRSGARDGRLRDPFLQFTAQHRAMGCQRMLDRRDGWPSQISTQTPHGSPTLAGWTSVTERAPLSGLASPELRLLVGDEVRTRSSRVAAWGETDPTTGRTEPFHFRRAGCDIDNIVALYWRDSDAYLNWLSQRFLRGAMSPRLRALLEQTMRDRNWNLRQQPEPPMFLLANVLMSPDFGVIR